jgi:hypothetical protein
MMMGMNGGYRSGVIDSRIRIACGCGNVFRIAGA